MGLCAVVHDYLAQTTEEESFIQFWRLSSREDIASTRKLGLERGGMEEIGTTQWSLEAEEAAVR